MNDQATYNFVINAMKMGQFIWDILDYGVDRKTYKFTEHLFFYASS